MLNFQDIIIWLRYFGMQYGYFGVFVISLIGALSIVVPVPDTIVLFTLAGLKIGGGWVFEPLLIALAAALGGVVGEFSGYLLGRGGAKVISGRYKKNMDFLARIFNRFGAVAIFAFALTPLPDDLVFIPLGVIHYNPIKAFASGIVGKFLMSLAVVYSARFSVGFISDVFGVGSSFMSVLVSTVVGIVLAVVMFKVDWAGYFENHDVKVLPAEFNVAMPRVDWTSYFERHLII